MSDHLDVKKEGELVDDIPSPCVRNCCLDNAEICLGCFRSLNEILLWNRATQIQKRAILAQSRSRKDSREAALKGL